MSLHVSSLGLAEILRSWGDTSAIHHTKAEPQSRTHAHASFEGVMVRTVETEKEKRAREALEATEIAVPLDVRPRRSRPLHRHALTLPLYPFPTSTQERAQDPDASEERQPPLRQVLIPIDGNAQSEYMVDWALANFCRAGDQINILHVIPK